MGSETSMYFADINHACISFASAVETVDADKVYVLGGLVDESIQKVFCFKTDYNRDIVQ